MERPVGIHQDDLVTGHGWGFTEGRQGVVTARAEGYVGLVMEQESHFFFNFPSLLNAAVFWVLVHSGLGCDEGSGTTEVIVVIVDSYDTPFVGRQELHGGVAWFATTRFAGSLRSMMDLSNGYLKGVVHFKLFVAVQGLC